MISSSLPPAVRQKTRYRQIRVRLQFTFHFPTNLPLTIPPFNHSQPTFHIPFHILLGCSLMSCSLLAVLLFLNCCTSYGLLLSTQRGLEGDVALRVGRHYLAYIFRAAWRLNGDALASWRMLRCIWRLEGDVVRWGAVRRLRQVKPYDGTLQGVSCDAVRRGAATIAVYGRCNTSRCQAGITYSISSSYGIIDFRAISLWHQFFLVEQPYIKRQRSL